MNIDTNTPHVEPGWANDFLLELRLRGVSGQDIGSALAEVEAHCAESGESAYEAFGQPAAYAAELGLTPAPDQQLGPLTLVHILMALAGMLITIGAFGAWRAGTDLEITSGSLASMGIVVVGAVLLVTFADQIMRAVVQRWWLAVLAGIVVTAAFVGVLLLGREPLFSVPITMGLPLGVALLLIDSLWTWRERATIEDPIVGPKAAGGAGTMASTRSSRGVAAVGPFAFLTLTALMCVPLLFL